MKSSYASHVVVAVLSLLMLASASQAQRPASNAGSVKICPMNVMLTDELTIRAVKVTGRRGVGALEKRLTAMFKGKTYTRDLHREAMKEVEDALTSEVNASFEKQTGIIGGATHEPSGAAFLRTDPCVEIESATKSVVMIVRVLFLRLDLNNLASNLLTLPRSIEPSFYDKMPAVLRAFGPVVDFDYDRRTGPLAALNVSTNLIELPRLLRGASVSDSDLRMDLDFDGQKSFTKPFYRAKTAFALLKSQPGKVIEQLNFKASFVGDDQPLNDRRLVDDELRLAGQFKIRPRSGLLNTLFLSGSFSGNKHDLLNPANQHLVKDRDHEGSFRAVVDGRIFDGFARMGLWCESSKINRSNNSYQRLAAIGGYQKEFGKNTQTIGLEVLGGAGRAWGAMPAYAGFFGGSSESNFLYDSPNSSTMTEFPRGPLVRSYGKSQAGARIGNSALLGGRDYWHANVTLSLPIKPWSRRLIPDEVVTYDDGDIKLNTLLENFTIKTAVGTIGDDLLDGIIVELMKQDPNLSEDEAAIKGAPIAEEKARRIVEKDVAPNVRFIARHANLFAVKPLLMFDAAGLGAGGGAPVVHRFAAGGGLQFVVVIARAEFGYMRSIPQFNSEPKGNVVFRLTFQNLF